MRALIIVAGILLLLVLILITRVKLLFSYQDQLFILKIRLFGLRYQVYPTKKKADESLKKEKQEEHKEDSAALRYLKDKFRHQDPATVWRLIRMVFHYVGKFLSGVRVQKLQIRIIVAKEDAAATAIAYGKTWAIVSGVLSFLENYIKIVKTSIDISPDFLAENDTYETNGIIDARIGHIILTILAVILALIRFDAGSEPEVRTQENETMTNKAVRS